MHCGNRRRILKAKIIDIYQKCVTFSGGPMLASGDALAPSYFLKFIKFVNKILYFYILFYLYLYN